MLKLIDECKFKNNVKPVLVLDSKFILRFNIHTDVKAHHNPVVKQLASQYFELKYMPAYSCGFNSIESMWSVVRNSFNKRITQLAINRDYGQADVVEQIQLAV